MVFGKNFVWLHFPKCAGHTVEQALRSLGGKAGMAFDSRSLPVGWHDTIEDRRQRNAIDDFSGKQVVCGFRRLPHWILSRVHYDASRPPHLCATRAMIRRGEFFEAQGEIKRADDYVRHFGRSKVDRWIRTEHLAEDFERHFSELLGTPLAGAAVRRLRRIVNGTSLNYVRSLGFYFTADELSELYESNPLWAAVEQELYGDVLRLPDEEARCFYVVDRRMRFLAATAPALEAWGKGQDEVIGRRLTEVFPLAEGSEAYEAQLSALRTLEPVALETTSPTFTRPVEMESQPTAAGLQVSFALRGG